MSVDVYVTKCVDKLILGYDFLERNKCEWLFSEHPVVINGLSIPLHSRSSKCTVPRTRVSSSTTRYECERTYTHAARESEHTEK